jgi:23S rRNA pseudouridine2605 synthase
VAAERLQKIIAAAGITSRRKAEELITQGRVTVNGQVITELGSKADPEQDHIKVDGKLLRGAERHIYLLLNKPKGYVTTVADPEGRPTVMDLVKHVGERIYPVGRLDYASEGLLLMTNDGELANFLTRAASHVPKTYLVKIAGQASEEDIDKLRHGLRIGSKPRMRGMQAVRTAPAQVNIVREGDNPWYEVTLIEGKNRQIRRMFEEIGHHVEKIKRVRYGSLTLDVEPGKFRELAPHELVALRKAKPRPGQGTAPKSAAKGAARYIGKPRAQRRDQDRFRPRKERAHTTEEQGEHAKPKFGRRSGPERPKFGQRAEGERPKFAPRGERPAAGQEKRRDAQQPRFERDSQRPRKFNRGDRRSEARGPRSRFKH